jgi:glycosyltransferase involved in cell wall biosynthesis
MTTPMKTPRVSVVLPTYNHAHFLPQAVASVLAQTFADLELIIVNDGSTDGTRDYLATVPDPRVRVIHQENQRLPRALNNGFQAARGELLTWTSADNYCAPVFLEALVAALDAHADAALAIGAFAFVDADSRIRGVHRVTDLSLPAVLSLNPGVAAFLYRRQCLDTVGPYEPELNGAEDWDMWLRIVERFPAVVVPELLYYYRQHDDSMTARIPGHVASSSRRVIERALERRKGQVDLQELYPFIRDCANPELATTHAAFDFGTRLLRSHAAPPALAVQFLAAAFERQPDPGIAANLMVAFARCGDREAAAKLAAHLHAQASRQIHALIKLVQRESDPAAPALRNGPLFVLNDRSELIQHLQRRQRTYSFTANVAVARDVAPPPPVVEAQRVEAGDPLLSVIITTYNRPDLLERCLEGFAGQSLSPSQFEVIVVDDGSEPPVEAIVRKFDGRFRVTYRHQANSGLAAARNTGIALARGGVIVPYDDDDVPHPDCLGEHLNFHRAHPAPEDAMLANLEWLPGLEVTPLMRYVTEVDPRLWCLKGLTPGQPLAFGFLWGGCSSYKKALIQRAGGFDARFRFGYEDTEAEVRMRRHGLRVWWHPAARNFVASGVTYEAFCRRCYRQGRSLIVFQRMYPDDPQVKAYAGTTHARDLVARLEPVVRSQQPLITSLLKAGWTLPEKPSAAKKESLELLHQLLFLSFEYWKNKGVLDAAEPPPVAAGAPPPKAGGKRVLVVDPFLPAYDRSSGSRRLFEMLKLLVARGDAVTYIARDGRNGKRYVAELQQLGIEVHAGDPDRMRQIGLACNAPPLDLPGLLRKKKFDVAILSFWYVAEQYLDWIRRHSPRTLILADTVDVHFVREQRQAELQQSDKLRAVACETKRRELAVYNRADALITVTEEDRRVLLEELPQAVIHIVPNIHDVPADALPLDGRRGILFVGNFNHPPNADGVLWFHHHVWPRVRAALPGVTLTIVGNAPPPAIMALAGDGITVTGHVPDTGPFLRAARVSVAPLRYGAGMKGKIGEALASGLPVVTTSIGAEGMTSPGRPVLLVADDPEAFADAIVRLHRDDALWSELAANGRAHVATHYGPAAVATRLEDMFSSQPMTSIVILTHNQIEHTRKCLDSIAAHTPQRHELILVDNASTDGTLDYLRDYARRHGHVRVIVNATNRGFAAGNNQGMAIARGDTVLLLNNDTVVADGWLGRMLAVFARRPDAGLAGPMSNYVSGPQWISPAPYETLDAMPAFAARWAAGNAGRVEEVNRLVGFCLLARREVIERIGGLDERFGSGNFEDDDYCVRAALAGFKAVIARDAFVHHTGSQTFRGAKIDYREAMLRNWELFKAKWHIAPETPVEKGYRLTLQPSPDLPVRSPLPDLGATHEPCSAVRVWREKNAESSHPPAPRPLPPVARVGSLEKAGMLLQQKNHLAAWGETVAAMQARPFHPAGCLLLSRIAQSAGDPAMARRCAQWARDLAPDWKDARKHLKKLPVSGRTVAQEWLAAPVPRATPQLSVCVIARNEEKFLARCLASVRGLAHQIVVVDTGSTDRTVEIAREHGAEVHAFAWCDDFSAARNAAHEHATGDWVLILDADEELAPDSREQLLAEMRARDVMAYRIRIVNAGEEQEGCCYVPRLFRNAPGLHFVGRVHEQIFSSVEACRKDWGLKNALGKTTLIHYGYDKAVIKDRGKVERNLRLLARAIAETPNEPSLLMNYGLDLVNSGQTEAGLEKYAEALRIMAAQPAEATTPEVRERLLTLYSTHLIGAQRFADAVALLQSPVARAHGLTATLHFTMGLSCVKLSRYHEAMEHMRHCLAKRGAPALTPAAKEVRCGGPQHCLAICFVNQKQFAAAEEQFLAAVAEAPESKTIRFDFARFLAGAGRPIEALTQLHALVAEHGDDADIWQLGGQIALSKPELAGFAADWTGEAVAHLPRNAGILLQRADALLVNGDPRAALTALQPVNGDATCAHEAVRSLCRVLCDQPGRPLSSVEEPEVSREFMKRYRWLVAMGASSAILQINQRLAQWCDVLPGAARVVGAVLEEAGSVAGK